MHKRQASQGILEAYVRQDGRVAVIIELNCETDFVARTDEFRTLARELAMQVVATNPRTVGSMEDDISDPATLLGQPYVRDETITVRELIRRTVRMAGEQIEVGRFVRVDMDEPGS